MALESAPGGPNRAISFLASHNGQRLSIAAFSIAATLVLVLFPGSIAAYVFGLPLLFFVPGFAVVRLFFWKGTSQEAKFVLSLGLSILAVIVLAAILVLTPIGLASNTARGSLVVFALSAVVLETTWLKADRAGKSGPAEEVPEPTADEHGKPDKVVAAMIATALVISVVSLGLIVTADYPSRTSFSLTDPDGKVVTNGTRPYGTSLVLVFHVKNGEDGQRTFIVKAYADNVQPVGAHMFDNKTYTKENLSKGGEWSEPVTLSFSAGGVYRMNFDLYIQEQALEPVFYGQLHMWFVVV